MQRPCLFSEAIWRVGLPLRRDIDDRGLLAADVKAVSRRGQTTADMANGPYQRTSPYPATIALLEGLGSKTVVISAQRHAPYGVVDSAA
jgi:hypothetical protein